MSRSKPIPDKICDFYIIKDLGHIIHKNAKKPARRCIALCPKCNEEFETAPKDLYKIQSCFCNKLPNELRKELRLIRIYKDMKKRCYNKNHVRYHRYGGRGIKISSEWKTTESFILWAISNGYSKNLTLDRINNDGDYEPSNCRWTDSAIQMQNSSKAKLTKELVLNIRNLYPNLSYSKLAKLYNVNKSTIANIILKKTWSNI